MTALNRQNDLATIRRLLMDPGAWAVVGLSTNRRRPAWGISRWLSVELGKPIIPVHPKAEEVHGARGYATLADIPDQDLMVVDCFVNSGHVGAVVDQAIREKERLRIDAVWMQVGVIDVDAADRARDAGLAVVMDTCPRTEWPRVRQEGMQR